jgi:predicted amidohydrolase YtcJ
MTSDAAHPTVVFMATIVLRNGRIGIDGPTGDVVIHGGTVSQIGPRCDVRDADVVDLGGATVLPGLWDSHVHSVQWALARRRLDLSDARSARAAAKLAIQASEQHEGIVVGYGFRDALWPDAPHKDLLAAAGPVVLVSNDLHAAWLSPAALAQNGRGGHPTGLLREHECFEILTQLPSASPDRIDAWVAEATRAAAARGVVGILDFEMADNTTDWGRRVGNGVMDVRVRCSVPRDRLDEAIDRGLRTGEQVPGTGGLLEVGPVKLFADGSLTTRTAYCADPYPATGTRGQLETPSDELEAIMRRAAEGGLDPAVHAIGDLAGALVLDAFEAIGCGGRIEHAQLVRAEDIPRFARPGLVTSVQPAHCPDDRDIADVHWHGRTGRAYPYADLLAAGAVLEFGSDAPVAPLDPWDGIAAAVARTDDDRPAWHPEQALTVADALAASSNGRRTVIAGSAADLVIVADDPSHVSAASLRDMPVLGTLLAGRWTHRDDTLR